ncbi:MAG: hypothetical protein M9894_10960 [Planctomycetes bacterium]|nr:hypothetical protein [Planctomycetota bacterium]
MRPPRSSRSLTRARALLLAVGLALAPGCQALGRGAQGFYEASADVFTPNPVAVVPFYVGTGLGMIVASPLALLSWPLAALFGPEVDQAYGVAARLAPALALGVLVGDLLAAPFWPFGLPFTPDPPEAVPDPRPGPPLVGTPPQER